MEAFSERLLREHQPAWQAMQQHPFVTDIEQDRLPTVVFNRYQIIDLSIFSFATCAGSTVLGIGALVSERPQKVTSRRTFSFP